MPDLRYYPRAAADLIRQRLTAFPVVVLTGARQTGKSTLARHLGEERARTYLTLDEMSVLDQALESPEALLSRGDRLTLDEVQRVPELLSTVKWMVDEDRTPGRFLLTGSTNLALTRGVSESLAGRAVYVTLWPMTPAEAVGNGSTGQWDAIVEHPPEMWAASLRTIGRTTGDQVPTLPEMIRRSGYPQPAVHLGAEADRAAWFDGYLQTYLERDLRQLSSIDNLIEFRRLIRATCLRTGNLLNQAELGRDVGLPSTTTQRYLGLLEASYQLTRLEPYSVNRTKRLVKSPKMYWSDTAFAMHLAGVETPSGAHLENLILNDLLSWRELRTPKPTVMYWRTSAGAEVDFVIETPQALLPIEVKTRERVRAADARHLHTFVAEYEDKCRAGLLLYGGAESYWLTEKVYAVPWTDMLAG